MICQKIQTLGHIGGGFRLLNSEIGNDQKGLFSMNVNEQFCFRLLNSEIGNDLMTKITLSEVLACFRLLNSEIGNDPTF